MSGISRQLEAGFVTVAVAACVIGCGTSGPPPEEVGPEVRQCGDDELGYGWMNLGTGNSCRYEIDLEHEKIVGVCNGAEMHDERSAGVRGGATLRLSFDSDTQAVPYERFDFQMGFYDGKTFWSKLEGFRWSPSSSDESTVARSSPTIGIDFVRFPDIPSSLSPADASTNQPEFSVVGGVKNGIGAHPEAFDFQILSVHEVCQREDEGYFLAHGSLDAACTVWRENAPTTEQAKVHIAF